jgi:hypothetical protein
MWMEYHFVLTEAAFCLPMVKNEAADEVQDSASNVILVSCSLGRYLVEKGAEEVAFLSNSHLLWWNTDNFVFRPMWMEYHFVLTEAAFCLPMVLREKSTLDRD